MTEKTYHRPCAVCASDLEITLDVMSEDIAVRPANLPPLAKDKLAVVAVYKRLKGLGAEWQKSHGARGIIYASKLLETVGVQGGQVDRAVGLMQWLKDSGREWSLDSAPAFWGEYQAHVTRSRRILEARCRVCELPAEAGANLCRDHSFCFFCDKDFPDHKAPRFDAGLPWCGCGANQEARRRAFIGGKPLDADEDCLGHSGGF